VSPAPKPGLFRSAVTESDGVTVNVGYLALFWLMVAILTAIPMLVVLAVADMMEAPGHPLDLRSLGYAIGAVCAGFATALGALGVFVYGDRRFSDPPAAPRDHDSQDPPPSQP
jgi:hypothetical protein